MQQHIQREDPVQGFLTFGECWTIFGNMTKAMRLLSRKKKKNVHAHKSITHGKLFWRVHKIPEPLSHEQKTSNPAASHLILLRYKLRKQGPMANMISLVLNSQRCSRAKARCIPPCFLKQLSIARQSLKWIFIIFISHSHNNSHKISIFCCHSTLKGPQSKK